MLYSSQMLCSKCHTAERIPGQRWCRECLTAYQRQRRERSSPVPKAVRGNVIHPDGQQETGSNALASVTHTYQDWSGLDAKSLIEFKNECVAVWADGSGGSCSNCGYPFRPAPGGTHTRLGP
jgi:hypothetical protein